MGRNRNDARRQSLRMVVLVSTGPLDNRHERRMNRRSNAKSGIVRWLSKDRRTPVSTFNAFPKKTCNTFGGRSVKRGLRRGSSGMLRSRGSVVGLTAPNWIQ
jgi:hypothetical protein